MKRLITVLCTLVLFAFTTVPVASAADIVLFDYAFNVDGDLSEAVAADPLPPSLNSAGFDFDTGLGTLLFTITGAGSHSVITFLDHEIDEGTNTFFNEYGAISGTAADGQSWEIDEPGYVFGDIYSNMLDGLLDNSNAVPAELVDDVSMALGWDFMLGELETAYISFLVGPNKPGGFSLGHYDPDSEAAIYFSSSLRIGEGVTPPIPEPGTWVLLLTGLGLTGGMAAKRSGKRSK